jgi:hypothetical protein
LEKESSEDVVTLHDDDPILVARMLLYLYTSDYKPDKKKPDLIRKIMIQATFITINVEPYEEVPEVILAAQMYRSQCRAVPGGDREDPDVESFSTDRHHLRLES